MTVQLIWPMMQYYIVVEESVDALTVDVDGVVAQNVEGRRR